MLRAFGIPEQTEAVYLTLMRHPGASSNDLATRLGTSRAALELELDRLCELDLVLPAGDSSGQWHPRPPDQAYDILLAREEDLIARRRERIAAAKESVNDFIETYVSAHRLAGAPDAVEVLDSAPAVRSRIFTLSSTVRERVDSMISVVDPSEEATADSRRSDELFLSRGVRYRLIVTGSSLKRTHWREHVEALVQDGSEVRIHPAPPLMVAVFDGTTAVIPGSSPAGALAVYDPCLVAPVTHLFEATWHAAIPLDTAPGDQPSAETRAHMQDFATREIVILLAKGLKDDVIARRMQISVRTVRRVVAALMESLHAESRFQAGVLCERQDLLR